MKRMKLMFVLLIVTFGFAFCQPDKTFKEVVTFEKGFRFSEAGEIQLEPYLGSVSSQIEWTDVLNKPEVFPPDMNAIETLELTQALEQLGFYFDKTTEELDAIVPPKGQGIAIDKTLGVYKVYSEGHWKIIATTN